MAEPVSIHTIREQEAVFEATRQRLGGDLSQVTEEEFAAEVLRGPVPDDVREAWLRAGVEALVKRFESGAA